MSSIIVNSSKGTVPPLLAVNVQMGEHSLVADTGPDNLGNGLGPDAHDLYDAALAACKAMTVLWYARKKGLPVTSLRAETRSDRSHERQGSYRLSTDLVVTGDLTESQVRELQSAAERCPIHRLMTQVTTEIETRLVHDTSKSQ
jgi:putative redox protein